ncbi:MAG: DUF1698 domain-containing protein [Candidatus Omnitrophica bacterium]|nr:DUF1698 domain-containing protein [Candidatus Omnitrophota bacterium]
MNLKSKIKKHQLEEARCLVIKGLINYQPYIFADDLQTGVGFEFLSQKEGVGLVYWPTIPKELLRSPEMKRFIIDNSDADDFIKANERLRLAYNSFIDQICFRIGDIHNTTFADIGCNSGYFPISLSLRGAKEAVGYDRQDYSKCFNLFNGILGTNAIFSPLYYGGVTHSVSGCKTYDVVLSMMVLCHLSDTLQHLSFLGSIAKKAIFIWTLVADDEDYTIRFGEPNKYYKNDKFPFCFDNMVRPSLKLLYKSLELMGFTNIYEVADNGQFPEVFYNVRNKAIIALRN